MNPDLHKKIADILATASDMTIATQREDGYPQATMVSFVSDGLSIYFGTSALSQKSRNIAFSDKVSIAITLPYSSWDEIRGVSLAGTARVIDDFHEKERIGKLMFAKFPQVLKYVPPDPAELLLYAVTPIAISVLDYAQGFGHTDLVMP